MFATSSSIHLLRVQSFLPVLLCCPFLPTQESFIWKHVSLEIKSIFFSFQIFPLYPHSSHIREKNGQMLVRVYINHTKPWSSYPVTITHHTLKVFLWKSGINYILLASILNLMLVIVNYWKHKGIAFVCCSWNMEYEHQSSSYQKLLFLCLHFWQWAELLPAITKLKESELDRPL